VDTFTVSNRIPLGSEAEGVFLGKARQDGTLLVSKMAAGEVLTVNTATHEVTNTFSDVPLHGGVLADADLSPPGRHPAREQDGRRRSPHRQHHHP
jgi:hypothetical protein